MVAPEVAENVYIRVMGAFKVPSNHIGDTGVLRCRKDGLSVRGGAAAEGSKKGLRVAAIDGLGHACSVRLRVTMAHQHRAGAGAGDR